MCRSQIICYCTWNHERHCATDIPADNNMFDHKVAIGGYIEHAKTVNMRYYIQIAGDNQTDVCN